MGEFNDWINSIMKNLHDSEFQNINVNKFSISNILFFNYLVEFENLQTNCTQINQKNEKKPFFHHQFRSFKTIYILFPYEEAEILNKSSEKPFS